MRWHWRPLAEPILPPYTASSLCPSRPLCLPCRPSPRHALAVLRRVQPSATRLRRVREAQSGLG